ncbi:Transporter, major facilitator family protein [Aphelenchoides besseyi]|nr:Transporter, major facilitator family protein [Aphelenchoides besseyi]
MTIRDPVALWLSRQTPKLRMFLVIGGAVLIHLSLGNMNPYMASFIRNYTDSSVTLEKLIWIPTFQGCFPFAMVIGGFLSKIFGPRLAAAIGCFLMSHSFWLFLVTYGFMFGLGQGIAYVIAVSCVINWFPSMVGFGSGIVAAGFGISSSIFAPIQTRLINRENLPATVDGYFTDRELLERVPSVFLELSIVYAIMQLVGLVVICDPPDQFARKNLNNSALIDMTWLSKRRNNWINSFNSNNSSSGSSFSRYGYVRLPIGRDTVEFESPTQTKSAEHVARYDSDASSDDELANKLEPSSLTPREMLRSSTFYWLFAALFCCSFYGNFFYNDDYFLATAFSIGSIANAAARIGWGWLTDKTSFQVALSSATSLATVLLVTMPTTAYLGKGAYLIWLTLLFVCLAATHALFITAAVRCFGTQHKTINYGCLIFSTTLSGATLAIGCQHFLQVVGYSWAFVITAIFPFIVCSLVNEIVLPVGEQLVYVEVRKKLLSFTDCNKPFQIPCIRQKLQSVDLENSCAIPNQNWLALHCSLDSLSKRQVAVARLKSPVNFGAGVGDVQFVVLVLGSCAESSWYFGKGIVEDFRRRWKFYASDYVDDVRKQILSQLIAGITFSLGGGQLFLIMLSTAPISIYIDIIQHIADSQGYDFFKLYTTVGLCSLEELFGLFIALALVFRAITAAVNSVNSYDPNCAHDENYNPLECERSTGLLFLLLMIGTFWLSVFLFRFRTSPFLSQTKRNLLSDYALPVAVVIMAAIGIWVFADVPRETFSFDSSASVFVFTSFWDQEWKAHLIAFGLGIPLAVLFFMDQLIVTNTVDNSQNKLQKGPATNWDLFVVAILNTVLSILGLPWCHGALPQAFLHLRALADIEDRLVDGTLQSVIVKNRETRCASLIAHIIMIVPFCLLSYLQLIPTAVFHGLFLYLAFTSTVGNEFCERVFLLFTEQRSYPPYHYLRRVPQRVVHLFTLFELAQLCLLCFIGIFTPWTILELAFPVITFLFIPIRSYVLPFFFQESYLEALDAAH